MKLKLDSWQREYLILCLLFFSVILFCLPDKCHESDRWCWFVWSKYIFENGLSKAYDSGTDYLPLYHYILKLYSTTQSSVESISLNMKYLKLVTLIFHFISCYFLILILKIKSKFEFNLNYILFYFLNISVLYNTILWGQVDEILTCFIIAAIYFAVTYRTFLSMMFYILALNFKLHAIIFLPVIGLILLPEYWIKKKKNIIIELILLGIIQLLIISPFYLGNGLEKLWLTVFNSVDKYPYVSMNAYNFWYLFFQSKCNHMQDSLKFLGLSYKKIGLLLFFATSFFALLPHLKYSFNRIFKHKNLQIDLNQLLLTCSLIPLLFFFFNTQMHERYVHPSLIFAISYSILNKRFIIGLLISLAYLLNLDSVLSVLTFQNYGVFIFNDIFISILFLITIFILFYELYFRKQPIDLIE